MTTWQDAAPTWGEMEQRAASAPTSPVTRTSALLADLFASAFARHGGGEHITFETIVQALPDPAEQGRWNPMVLVYAEIAALSPSTSLYATSEPVQLNGWRQEDADVVAQNLVGMLFSKRKDEQQVIQQQAEQAAREGSPPPHSGPLP